MIKALKKLGTEGKYLNTIKATNDQPMVNIMQLKYANSMVGFYGMSKNKKQKNPLHSWLKK
jgi:hypothetical protein